MSSIALNGERVFKNFSLKEISAIELNDGDEIFVHKLSNTPRNIVKIIGEIATQGSVAFESGLTLEQIIKKESFLESTYTPFVIIERENAFGSKSLIRSNLLWSSSFETTLMPNDLVYVLSRDDISFLNSILVADALNLLSKKDNDKLSSFFGIEI